MSNSRLQNLFFCFALLLFSFLLLGGGSRLIAGSEEGFAPLLPAQSWYEASLTCPPASTVYEAKDTRAQEYGERSQTRMLGCLDSQSFSFPQTDANGNILRHASYMHAVYQVFALGDGFV